jgi:hypothetical protein
LDEGSIALVRLGLVGALPVEAETLFRKLF